MTTALGTGLRRAAARLVPDPAPIPDGELLARFLAARDEAAFAALVRRHAGLVFGTCRRVLGNAADADDAFQAAFVVLVRKAHSLTGRPCVGNFLYGVAFHTALKARAMATKRRAKEVKATRPEQPDAGELTRVLDEELAKLPDKYREPVVLCELEGVSRKDAAARLGVPEGTISSRLATAHRMLHKRLTGRGFASVAVAAVLGSQAVAVADSLTAAAVRSAVDGPPAAVTQLASEVSKMLLLNQLRVGAVLAGVVLAVAVGVGVIGRGFADDKPAVKVPVPAKDAKKPDDAKKLQGTWVTKGVTFDPPMPVPPGAKQEHAHHTLTFTDTDLTWVSYIPTDPKSRSTQTKPFKLDQTASPKELTSGDNECVYELDGDTLKVAMNALTPGRPKGFNAKDSPPGKGHVWVIELTRDKAEGDPNAKPSEKKPEIDKGYSLKNGEVLKLIPAPFPDDRETVFKQVNQRRSLAGGSKVYRMVIPADGAELRQCFAATSAENGWQLRQALTAILNIDPMDCVADDKLLAAMFDADTLVRPDTPAEKLLPALQAELKAKCGIDVTLEFRQMEREVVVASGTYFVRAGPNQVEPRHEYALDTDEPKGKPNWGTHMFNAGFVSAIGTYVRRPVIDETNIKSLPTISFSLNEYDHKRADDPKAKVPDPETVLKRLADQTGLTFKLEKRKVRALVIEPAKKEEPKADKSYSLKDGEVLKLIPAPFPDEREGIYTKFDAASGIRPAPPHDTMLMAVTVKDGQPASASAFTNRRTPGLDTPGKPLALFLGYALRTDMAKVADPKWLLESTVLDADVVVKKGADPSDVVAALDQELRAKYGVKMSLKFEEAEREVVVISGKHTLKADPPADPSRPYDTAPVVHLFATDKQEHPDGLSTDSAGLVAEVAKFVGRPVIDESDLKKKGLLVTVRFHVQYPETAKTRAADRDPAKVLKNLEGQTGLTFKLEKRKVRVLVVDGEPAWKEEFRKAYGLADGQLVRRVPLPHPDCRAKMFDDMFPDRQGNIPTEEQFSVFQWKGDWLGPQFGQMTMPIKPEVGVPLARLLEMALNLPQPRIEDRTGLGAKVTGDFVVRAGADPEKVAAQLEKLLRKECELPVKFAFKDAEEEVFVLGGKYKAAPLNPDKPDQVEVFARYRNDGTFGGGGSGTLAELVAAVEKHTGKRVVLGEVTGGPKRVSWHFNDRKEGFTQKEYEEDRNVAVVLGNVAAQTGLEVTTEKRKVRVLVVSPADE